MSKPDPWRDPLLWTAVLVVSTICFCVLLVLTAYRLSQLEDQPETIQSEVVDG